MNMKYKNLHYLLFLLLLGINITSCGQDRPEMNLQKKADDLPRDEAGWKKVLTDEQYYVLRQKGTEKPYTGKLLLNKEKGVYKCAACGNELFTDDMKFDSHCGWPSFDREIKGGKIIQREDRTHGMVRTEIMCAKCGGHLGHIFDDGPTQTGMRYCVNSVSLEFVPEAKENVHRGVDTITLGGGCFWCIEAIYEKLEGVLSVESGYSGGKNMQVNYHEVGNGNTGHAEVTQIIFDKSRTNLDEILKVFFTVHDPTTLNRQGADVGTQYRSVIFYRDQDQKKSAESLIGELDKSGAYDHKIVTEVSPYTGFVRAEEYHQDYYRNNREQPYCQMVIQPKLDKFEKVFKDRIKKEEH